MFPVKFPMFQKLRLGSDRPCQESADGSGSDRLGQLPRNLLGNQWRHVWGMRSPVLNVKIKSQKMNTFHERGRQQ